MQLQIASPFSGLVKSVCSMYTSESL